MTPRALSQKTVHHADKVHSFILHGAYATCTQPGIGCLTCTAGMRALFSFSRHAGFSLPQPRRRPPRHPRQVSNVGQAREDHNATGDGHSPLDLLLWWHSTDAITRVGDERTNCSNGNHLVNSPTFHSADVAVGAVSLAARNLEIQSEDAAREFGCGQRWWMLSNDTAAHAEKNLNGHELTLLFKEDVSNASTGNYLRRQLFSHCYATALCSAVTAFDTTGLLTPSLATESQRSLASDASLSSCQACQSALLPFYM